MRKREIFWVVLLLVVVGAFAYRHWKRGQRQEIKVIYSLRPIGTGGRTGTGRPFPVLFQLDASYRLNSLEVIEVQTNKPNAQEHILWHLVSDTGSDPIKLFIYGQDIPGMSPYLRGVRIDPLVTNVQYRLEVTAGKIKGSTPFHTTIMP